MAVDKHIIRINDTWDNLKSAIGNHQIAILTDSNNELIARDGTDIHLYKPYKTWDGDSFALNTGEFSSISLEETLTYTAEGKGISYYGEATTGIALNGDSIDFTVNGTAVLSLPETGLDYGDLNGASDTKEPTGFVNRTDSTLSFNNSNRTLTISGTYDIYIYGVRQTITNDAVVIDNTVGLWFIYYNAAGALTASQTPWTISDTVQVCTVFWNGTAGLLGEERHGCNMSSSVHDYLHYVIGARYRSGFGLAVTNASSWTIDRGYYNDEDIINDSGASKTQARIFYRTASGFDFTAATGNLFKQSATPILQWNNGTALAEAGVNNYVAMWMFATNDISTPIALIMGQREDTTLANARLNNVYDTLVLSGLPYAEMKLLYRIIVQRNGTSVTYIESQDYRNVSAIPSGNYVATDHNALTNLAVGDPHTQYLDISATRYLTADFGIGQASTGARLHVYETGSSCHIRIKGDVGNEQGLYITDSADRWAIYKPASTTDLRIWNGSADVVTIFNNGDIAITSGAAVYFGATGTDGSYRTVRSGNDLITQRRESGNWVTKFTVSP